MVLPSFSTSGKSTDKIKALKELGFEFYKEKKIDVMMPKGSALNLECKVVQEVNAGSHTMFIGEVIEAEATEKKPLAYSGAKYWKLEDSVQKPAQEERDKMAAIVAKHSK